MSFMWVLLHRFILVFVSNSLASLNLVSRGNTSHASKILEPTTMPFVSTIPTYYMVFLRHSKVNSWVLPLNFHSSSLQYIAHGTNSLKTIVVLNMYLCILFLISCLLCDNHVPGDAINYSLLNIMWVDLHVRLVWSKGDLPWVEWFEHAYC